MAEPVTDQNAPDMATRCAAAKAYLRSIGMTQAAWADANGYSRKTVSKILNGERKAHFGVQHEIAVKLGIKDAPPGDQHHG